MIVRCLIPKLREERSWSQAELARRSGLSRQLIHNLENGSALPSIQTAFQLKKTFNCKIEDLFEDDDTPSPIPIKLLDAQGDISRVHLANISDKWVAYPADSPDEIAKGFSQADATLVRNGSKMEAAPIVSVAELSTNISIAGCDPALQLVREALSKSKVKAIVKTANSHESLRLLDRGLVHIAGVHFSFHDLDAAKKDAIQAKYPAHSQVFRFSTWEQGWAVAAGNPKKFRSIEDLIRRNIRIANREAGSGTRFLLDQFMKKAGIKASQIGGFDDITYSHFSCAQEVAQGRADAALTLRAIALALGLEFIPISRVSFDLVIPREFVNHPSIQILGNTLQSQGFQKNLASLPGYNAEKTGDAMN